MKSTIAEVAYSIHYAPDHEHYRLAMYNGQVKRPALLISMGQDYYEGGECQAILEHLAYCQQQHSDQFEAVSIMVADTLQVHNALDPMQQHAHWLLLLHDDRAAFQQAESVSGQEGFIYLHILRDETHENRIHYHGHFGDYSFIYAEKEFSGTLDCSDETFETLFANDSSDQRLRTAILLNAAEQAGRDWVKRNQGDCALRFIGWNGEVYADRGQLLEKPLANLTQALNRWNAWRESDANRRISTLMQQDVGFKSLILRKIANFCKKKGVQYPGFDAELCDRYVAALDVITRHHKKIFSEEGYDLAAIEKELAHSWLPKFSALLENFAQVPELSYMLDYNLSETAILFVDWPRDLGITHIYYKGDELVFNYVAHRLVAQTCAPAWVSYDTKRERLAEKLVPDFKSSEFQLRPLFNGCVYFEPCFYHPDQPNAKEILGNSTSENLVANQQRYLREYLPTDIEAFYTQDCNRIAVVAPMGGGKTVWATHLVRSLVEESSHYQQVIYIRSAEITRDINSVADFVARKLCSSSIGGRKDNLDFQQLLHSATAWLCQQRCLFVIDDIDRCKYKESAQAFLASLSAIGSFNLLVLSRSSLENIGMNTDWHVWKKLELMGFDFDKCVKFVQEFEVANSDSICQVVDGFEKPGDTYVQICCQNTLRQIINRPIICAIVTFACHHLQEERAFQNTLSTWEMFELMVMAFVEKAFGQRRGKEVTKEVVVQRTQLVISILSELCYEALSAQTASIQKKDLQRVLKSYASQTKALGINQSIFEKLSILKPSNNDYYLDGIISSYFVANYVIEHDGVLEKFVLQYSAQDHQLMWILLSGKLGQSFREHRYDWTARKFRLLWQTSNNADMGVQLMGNCWLDMHKEAKRFESQVSYDLWHLYSLLLIKLTSSHLKFIPVESGLPKLGFVPNKVRTAIQLQDQQQLSNALAIATTAMREYNAVEFEKMQEIFARLQQELPSDKLADIKDKFALKLLEHRFRGFFNDSKMRRGESGNESEQETAHMLAIRRLHQEVASDIVFERIRHSSNIEFLLRELQLVENQGNSTGIYNLVLQRVKDHHLLPQTQPAPSPLSRGQQFGAFFRQPLVITGAAVALAGCAAWYMSCSN